MSTIHLKTRRTFHCPSTVQLLTLSSSLQLTPARRPGSPLPSSLLAGYLVQSDHTHFCRKPRSHSPPMTTLQLAKADRSLGVEMKPSPVGEMTSRARLPGARSINNRAAPCPICECGSLRGEPSSLLHCVSYIVFFSAAK